MKAEAELRRDVGIGHLLLGQGDVKADAGRADGSATIGGLQNAWAAAGWDDIVAPSVLGIESATALRGDAAKLARDPIELLLLPQLLGRSLLGFAVRCLDSSRGLLRRRHTCTTEDDDGRADSPIAQRKLGLGVFERKSDRPHLVAQQEFGILNRKQRAPRPCGIVGSFMSALSPVHPSS
jgi:hypothetical protein